MKIQSGAEETRDAGVSEEQRAERATSRPPPWRASTSGDLVQPGSGYLGVREIFGAALGLEVALVDLGTLPQGRAGRVLMARRYFIENAEIWLGHFAWKPRLAALQEATERDLVSEVQVLAARVAELRAQRFSPDAAWLERLAASEGPLAGDLASDEALAALVSLSVHGDARVRLREMLRERAPSLFEESPELLDRLYLACLDLTRYPATSVSASQLEYVLVADKGEMGVRAVHEVSALGKTPVVLHSLLDDRSALQVRLAGDSGGFAIGLEGSFRESYANHLLITERVHEAFRERFGDRSSENLARAALYPGYGPLAENSAAISHFRRHGIIFVGPMQDVVERAGDKRRFRALVESIAPEAVTPGIVIAGNEPAQIRDIVLAAHAGGAFSFPGRLKAANGGGGRGQAIVSSDEALEGAIGKVLGEIESNRWEPGVMFEQNIQETIHLEVQILRDRYGNARHFGMRDCTEQRASQKIQEEAPPAVLQRLPDLRRWIEETAVQIADGVGYVGAGTVELMYKDGKAYFLEMNTRIQVEHPVSEECHAIRRPSGALEPLNLVRWQLRLADGGPIDFAQADVIQTHVAREFRINAESWHPTLKDARDGQRGLFVPNAGIFDRIELPEPAAVVDALGRPPELEDLKVRFDVGFAVGDVLVNKDPTFGKLIVAVRAADGKNTYELLRSASHAVLGLVQIEGRQVRPDGRVIPKSKFQTNLPEHRWILEHEVLRRHAQGDAHGRHVNWVIDALRAKGA